MVLNLGPLFNSFYVVFLFFLDPRLGRTPLLFSVCMHMATQVLTGVAVCYCNTNEGKNESLWDCN